MRSCDMKEKPLQNIVFGTNTKTWEAMVFINETTLEPKIKSI